MASKATKSGNQAKSILLDAAEQIRAEGFDAGCRHAAKVIMQMAKSYLEGLDKPAVQPNTTTQQEAGEHKGSKKGERYQHTLAIVTKTPGLRAEQIVQALRAQGDINANVNAVRTTLSRLKAD